MLDIEKHSEPPPSKPGEILSCVGGGLSQSTAGVGISGEVHCALRRTWRGREKGDVTFVVVVTVPY